MKKIVLSVCTVIAMNSLVFAGGDFKDVEPAVVPVVVIEDAVEKNFYVGLALSAVSTRDSSITGNHVSEKEGQDRLGNVSFLAGYTFNEYIAVEGRYTTSFTQEDMVVMDGWSLFVKPQYPVSENFSLYGLLGYGGVTLDNEHTPGIGVHNGNVVLENTDVDDSAFQWGLGMSYVMTESFDVFLDYTSLADNMDGSYFNGAQQVDVDTITLGVNYNF